MNKELSFLFGKPLRFFFINLFIIFIFNLIIHSFFQSYISISISIYISLFLAIFLLSYLVVYLSDVICIMIDTAKSTSEFWLKLIFYCFMISLFFVTYIITLNQLYDPNGPIDVIMANYLKPNILFLIFLSFLSLVINRYELGALNKITSSKVTIGFLLIFYILFLIVNFVSINLGLTAFNILLVFNIANSLLAKNSLTLPIRNKSFYLGFVSVVIIYLSTSFFDPQKTDIRLFSSYINPPSYKVEDLNELSSIIEWSKWISNVDKVFTPDETVAVFEKLKQLCDPVVRNDKVNQFGCYDSENYEIRANILAKALSLKNVRALLNTDNEFTQLIGVLASRSFFPNPPEDLDVLVKKYVDVAGPLSVAARNTLSLKKPRYEDFQLIILKRD